MNNTTNGAIIWSGKSLFDGEPIVAILTGWNRTSANTKTGWMVQTYVIRQDIAPTEAVKTKQDYSVCGNCPLRGSTCYVRVEVINNVWRKYQSGGYPQLNTEILNTIKRRSLKVRLTAYGEATAVPLSAWQPLLKASSGFTGYTHQWRKCDPFWQEYLMASVQFDGERAEAKSLGWRTFRVLSDLNDLEAGETICHNIKNEKIQCEACGLCNGNSNYSKMDVADPVHGINWKIQNFNKLKENNKNG